MKSTLSNDNKTANIFLQSANQNGKFDILRRYIHKGSNIQRVIQIERFTERGYMHGRSNIQRKIYTKEVYTQRKHIYGEDIYVKKQIYRDIYKEETFIQKGHTNERTNVL